MLVRRLKDGYIFELENVDVLKSLLEAKEIEEVKETEAEEVVEEVIEEIAEETIEEAEVVQEKKGRNSKK